MNLPPNTAKPGYTAPHTGNQASRPANTPNQPNMPAKDGQKDGACSTDKDGKTCATEKDAAKKSVA